MNQEGHPSSPPRHGMREERRYSYGRRQADVPALLASLHRLEGPDDFVHWCRETLPRQLPFGAFACCLGKVEGTTVTPLRVLSHGLPTGHPQSGATGRCGFYGHVLRHWLEWSQPILADREAVRRIIGDPVDLDTFHASGLCNLASHGMYDFTREYFSHFSFYRMPEPLDPRHGQLLEWLAPALHATLIRVARPADPRRPAVPAPVPLTPREREILDWIGAGKTNEEIALILGTRYKTVKNQVQSILAKLGVSNRAQAVAASARLGLTIRTR